MHVAGLKQLTSLDVARGERSPPLKNEELGHIAKLTSLRHLCLAGVWVLPEQVAMCTEELLSHLSSCAFLNVSPSANEDPRRKSSRPPLALKSWTFLVRLEYLSLRELHIGVDAPKPPHPGRAEAHVFYKEAQEALAGCPDRLGMALLRGTRGWPSQEAARAMLCRSRQLHS